MYLKKFFFTCIVCSAFVYGVDGQYHYVHDKLQISYDPRLETYFIAERLVAENIGNYVFSNKTFDYSGQPIVMAGFNKFKNYKDSVVILKLSALLDTLKPLLQDNAPIIEMLLYKEQFPAKGNQYPFKKLMLFDASSHPEVIGLIEQVIENLREFLHRSTSREFFNNERILLPWCCKGGRKAHKQEHIHIHGGLLWGAFFTIQYSRCARYDIVFRYR